MAFRLSNINIQGSTFNAGRQQVFGGWEKESERDFKRLVGQMQQTVKREAKVVVKNAARDTARELIKATPMGKGRTRGFAKAGWGNSMLALDMQPRGWFFRGSKYRGERWRDFGGHRDELNKRQAPTFTLINNVPYVQEMAGSTSVVPRAYRNAARKYDKRLSKMGKQMEKRWKR
jgi:hypothetical protein